MFEGMKQSEVIAMQRDHAKVWMDQADEELKHFKRFVRFCYIVIAPTITYAMWAVYQKVSVSK